MSDTLRTRMRINRVEYWKPPYNDDAPVLTQLELQDADGGQVRLRFDQQAGRHVLARLVLNVSGKVTHLEPGDELEVTFAKAAPVARRRERDEIPF